MSDIVIYDDGSVNLEISLKDDTLWLNANDISNIFGVNRPAIVKHVGNIYKSEELFKEATCSILEQVTKDGKKRKINLYNLDMIISIGYRVNSKKATKFRRWATNILKEYLIKGYALNKDKLQNQKLQELDNTLKLIRDSIEQKQISADEAKDAIEEFKKVLMLKGEASKLFGQEKAGEFKGNLLNIYQSFGGVDLLASIEQKAANLLYYVIKGHPFNDGNKHIGAYLFILFLSKNRALYKSNGELKINDNALASLALLVATSDPEQKDIIIKLIMNILYEGDDNE